MLKINSFELITFISNFFWPMIRILSFFSMTPIFDDKLFSKRSKIILSLIISGLISPFLPEMHVNLFSYTSLFILLEQIFIGIFLGLIVQFLFVTINLSGEIMSLQMGLSFANFFNNNKISASIISRLFNMLITLFFLFVNAHLYFISVLVDSFYKIPIHESSLNANIFFIILQFFGNIFLNGLKFSYPIIVIFLSISIIMSFLNRVFPQVSIFSVGFPLNLLVGMLVIYFLISRTFSFFQILLSESVLFLSSLLEYI